jgi:hypothetical protein
VWLEYEAIAQFHFTNPERREKRRKPLGVGRNRRLGFM